MRSFRQSHSSYNSENNDPQKYLRTSYNISYSKPEYFTYSNRRNNNQEMQQKRKYENKINQNQDNNSNYSNSDSVYSKKLICPDCFNRNIINDDKIKSNYQDKFIPRSFVDNLTRDDEKVIQDKIKQRENLTKEAGKYLNNIRDYNINKLQNENQNGDFYGTNLEHLRLRAQKKNIIKDNNLRNHMLDYSNFENPRVSDYYRKYVNNNDNDNVLIKEKIPQISKDEYNQMMIDQIEQNKRLRQKREYDEKMEDERLLRNQIDDDNRKIYEENLRKKENWNYYQDENLKLLKSKNLRNQAEDRERKYEENKIMKENEREMEKDYENAQKKRQEIIDLNRENYFNSKLKKQNELREREIESHRNYPGLCTHGCDMEKCDICKRLYPKQVLTKVVYNKKKKNLE